MKIAVASASLPKEAYDTLAAQGCEFVFNDAAAGRGNDPEEALIELTRDAECFVTTFASRKLIEASPTLHSLVSNAIGYDRIDVPAATEHGVLVCNSPSEENVVGVAEASIGLMVALAKKLKRKEQQLRVDGWGPRSDRGSLLWRKTVGIVGLGRIGSAVAKRLGGWDVRLLAYAPTTAQNRAAALGVTLVDLPALLGESDFVTLHLNMRPENRHFIGREELAMMKPSAFLVNMARGEVLDTDALCDAIENGKLAGAALDVFETEPLPMDDRIRSIDPERLILSPHTLSSSVESQAGNARVIFDNIRAILRGQVPQTVVNPEVVERWRGRGD